MPGQGLFFFAEGRGEHLICPRRAAKGHEENLFWSTKNIEGQIGKRLLVKREKGMQPWNSTAISFWKMVM